MGNNRIDREHAGSPNNTYYTCSRFCWFSGDLAPLAHMTAAMIGEGDVFFKNKRMNSKNAFKKVNLLPVKLDAKEGLGLINGTQFSTACALDGLFSAFDNAKFHQYFHQRCQLML